MKILISSGSVLGFVTRIDPKLAKPKQPEMKQFCIALPNIRCVEILRKCAKA